MQINERVCFFNTSPRRRQQHCLIQYVLNFCTTLSSQLTFSRFNNLLIFTHKETPETPRWAYTSLGNAAWHQKFYNFIFTDQQFLSISKQSFLVFPPPPTPSFDRKFQDITELVRLVSQSGQLFLFKVPSEPVITSSVRNQSQFINPIQARPARMMNIPQAYQTLRV